MPQGKVKITLQLETKATARRKPQANNSKNKNKQPIQRRRSSPIRPKKTKLVEENKLKKMITKTVNQAMEKQLRQKALGGKQSLTKAKVTSTTTTSLRHVSVTSVQKKQKVVKKR